MSILQLPSHRRDAKFRPMGLALLLTALVSAGVGEALRDHACTGDGCLLCIVAACAHVLLTVSLGATLVCHVVRFVSRPHVTYTSIWLRPKLCCTVFYDVRTVRVEMTPVTLGVRLLI